MTNDYIVCRETEGQENIYIFVQLRKKEILIVSLLMIIAMIITMIITIQALCHLVSCCGVNCCVAVFLLWLWLQHT